MLLPSLFIVTIMRFTSPTLLPYLFGLKCGVIHWTALDFGMLEIATDIRLEVSAVKSIREDGRKGKRGKIKGRTLMHAHLSPNHSLNHPTCAHTHDQCGPQPIMPT